MKAEISMLPGQVVAIIIKVGKPSQGPSGVSGAQVCMFLGNRSPSWSLVAKSSQNWTNPKPC